MCTHVGVPARFSAFAVGHFSLSIPGAFVLLFLLISEGRLLLVVLVSMSLYLPAGILTARWWGWPLPDLKTGLFSVLLPALCACSWAFGGWVLALMEGSTAMAGATMLLSSALFASPSFSLMLLTLCSGHFGDPWWYGSMVLASLLPPLLFFLGTLLPPWLGGKRRLTSGENVIK